MSGEEGDRYLRKKYTLERKGNKNVKVPEYEYSRTTNSISNLSDYSGYSREGNYLIKREAYTQEVVTPPKKYSTIDDYKLFLREKAVKLPIRKDLRFYLIEKKVEYLKGKRAGTQSVRYYAQTEDGKKKQVGEAGLSLIKKERISEKLAIVNTTFLTYVAGETTGKVSGKVKIIVECETNVEFAGEPTDNLIKQIEKTAINTVDSEFPVSNSRIEREPEEK